jgi:hypothetical protein
VVKAIWLSLALVAASALVLEVLKGLGFTMYVVFDEYLGLALDWIYKFVGLI